MSNLSKIIKSRIRDKGAITFAEFMELALYHPSCGYYYSGNAKIGKTGDFYTSPHVHTAFGSMIGNFIIKSFDFIGGETFSVIELGAGKGFLALDILNHIKEINPALYDRLSYLIAEQSDHSQDESKKTLRDHADKIAWHSMLDEIEDDSLSGIVISNELIDALAFHRLKFLNGKLHDTYVTLQNDEFVEITDKPSTDKLEKYLSRYEVHFIEGQEFEINLNAEHIFRKIGCKLHKGLILTIDYGYLASELFSPARMKGTYKCLYKHTINDNPYVNIGEQDITAHVDFSNLINLGESLNMSKVKYTSQGQFLVDWGILELINRDILSKSARHRSIEQEIQAVKNLFLPEMMGDRFKVLIQEKNLGLKSRDFYPESPFKISFNIL